MPEIAIELTYEKIIEAASKLRVWKLLTHWNWRTDLGQIWSIGLSKTASVVVPR